MRKGTERRKGERGKKEAKGRERGKTLRRKKNRREERKQPNEDRRTEGKKQNAVTVDVADVLHSAHGCNMDSGSGALMHVLVASQAAAGARASFPPLSC